MEKNSVTIKLLRRAATQFDPFPLTPETLEVFLQTEIPIHHCISHIDVVMKLASGRPARRAIAFEKFDWKDGVNDEYPRLEKKEEV